MRNILLLGGLGLVGYGAYTYYKTEVALLEESEISLSKLKILDKSPDNVTLRITVKVVNNSEQEFTIRKYDLMFLINNKFVGNIRNSDVDTKVKGFGGESFITFDFSFNPKEVGIADILYQLLQRKGNSTILVKGDISAKKGYLTVKAPLDIKYTLRELMVG